MLMKKCTLIFAIVAAAVIPFAFAQEDASATSGRDQARSMVMTKFGIVSTSQTLASQAGARILEEGGNAIDAAVARLEQVPHAIVDRTRGHLVDAPHVAPHAVRQVRHQGAAQRGIHARQPQHDAPVERDHVRRAQRHRRRRLRLPIEE